MTYTVKIEGRNYTEQTCYTFTDRQEAKNFFRAEQRKPTYRGGTAYDENFISIFADEIDTKIPEWIFIH